MKTIHTDVLIIGSGIAGLTTALSLSPDIRVLLLTKSRLRGANSYYAQGGVAVAFRDMNDITRHKEDTLRTGVELADEKAVDVLVGEGPLRIIDLIQYGVKFDRYNDKEYEYLKEGAHSKRRIMHIADRTGNSIENRLIQQVKQRENITVMEKCYLSEILVEGGVCGGAVVLDDRKKTIFKVRAKATVLATGGAGMVYEHNTNWIGSTGDGLAAAFRAGAMIRDMEFYQFHPTAIQLHRKRRGVKNFLISEAVRGEGAIVVDEQGKRFLFSTDERGELASRDIVSRAIHDQYAKGQRVYLDLTHMDTDVPKRFPVIYSNCLRYGIDITKTRVPIVPVAHYMIGGVQTDLHGCSSLMNLYACGEVASVGVHGANRLASNSILECLVFGHRVAYRINETIGTIRTPGASSEMLKAVTGGHDISRAKLTRYRKIVQRVMYQNVGIKRTGKGLREALNSIDHIAEELDHSNWDHNQISCGELRSVIQTARLITVSALRRQESRGAHYRTDYTKPIAQYAYKHTELTRSDIR